MNKSVFDYVGNLDTLAAVVVGAMLATLGALFAEMIEDRMNRRRRERDAARFFGEIIASIDRLVLVAVESQKFGDPWGRVTRRIFKTALHEAELYERNRERLFDIRDVDTRKAVHVHFLNKMFPLETMVEASEDLLAMDRELLEDSTSAARRADILTCKSDLANARETALRALVAEISRTDKYCERLEKIARVAIRDKGPVEWPPRRNPPDPQNGSATTIVQ
jgi:hypothetical protein